MNIPKPDANDIKSTVRDLDSMRLCGTLDAGVKLHRKGSSGSPLKSASFHTSCHIPVLRASLIALGAAAALCALVCFHRARCCKCRRSQNEDTASR